PGGGGGGGGGGCGRARRPRGGSGAFLSPPPGGRAPPRAGIVMTVASFDVTDGRVTRIWAVRNPEKLRPWARHDLS
ncbi:RNA polymerase subunit sigma-24, partial [Streptomyces globisporus]